jgi:GSH-dependent disulfide-bond oxidoreductase
MKNGNPEITLYTAPTPNGWKVSIALEELGLPYRVESINLMEGEQKKPAFRALNPNGRIPVIVDHACDDFVLFESGAILWYLAERCQKLIPKSPRQRALCHQWLMFQMSGVGPMMGQLNVFRRYFPTELPAAIERYHNETERLFGVLDEILQDRQYVLDEHSVADIALWSWIYTHRWSGVELDAFPNLLAWKRRLRQRSGYVKGVTVPHHVGRVLDEQGTKARAYAKAAQTLVTT